jgi:CubicO group peptidase (beta-lactamase class C family)
LTYPGKEIYAQSRQFEDLDAYIEKAMTEWQVPGLAIAIVKDDKVIYNKGFGVRDINKKSKVDTNTLFAIASNTKAFTTHALGLLVQEGKISWDDLVLNYLPDFQLYDPVVTRKITIRDLLCHRSGLGKWAGDLVWWGSTYTRKDMMERIRYIKPVDDFRNTYHYNNLMFLVAGQIIPAVTGSSWDDFLRERLFTPLQMRNTNTSINTLDLTGNVALPHTIRNKKVISVPYVNVDISGPAGAINSCTADLVHWLRLQLDKGLYNGGQLVNPEIIAQTRKSHTMVPISEEAKEINPYSHFSTYALGWFLRDFRGRLLVNHTGGLDGMYSYLGFMPDEKIGLVILTNLDHHSLTRALAYHVYDALLNLDFQDWSNRYLMAAKKEAVKKEKGKSKKVKIDGTKPTHKISDYLGMYSSKLYGEVEIYEQNKEVKIRLSPHPNIIGAIEHWQYETFFVKWNDMGWGESLLYFDLDNLGEIQQFRMSVRPDWIDTLEYTFVKVN